MSLWVAEVVVYRQAQESVQSLLQRLRPSIAVLGDLGHPSGTAALIDAPQGLFLAHADSVKGDTVQARLGDGPLVLTVLSRDPRTSLVLLRSKVGDGPIVGPALTLVENDPAPGSKILVLLPNSAVFGSFVGGGRYSILGARKQATPVSELRFETQLVSGALVLTLDGKLVGAVDSTVARSAPRTAFASPLRALGNVDGARTLMPRPLAGPGDLTVAYSPSLRAMRHVVDGFRSEDHRADYAVLGIQISEATDGGTRITKVFPDTPADRAGIKVDDVLLSIGDAAIQKRVDFIRAMLDLNPGETTKLRIRRKSTEMTVEVTVARSKG